MALKVETVVCTLQVGQVHLEARSVVRGPIIKQDTVSRLVGMKSCKPLALRVRKLCFCYVERTQLQPARKW